MKLVDRLLAGDVRALARAISLVEENSPQGVELLHAIFPRTGRATVIGITGSPGSGKSSLVDRMVGAYRSQDRRVGVVAVDPTSAFSGGAVLGDRVRMQSHATDPGVFIRSMATRGFLGGLARTTSDAVDLLDAAGYDPILVETVGVGQDEVEVVKTADAVVVVLVPGMGDGIQALKAGILEIADLFVINKCDHPGADRLEAELDYMLALSPDGARPRPKVHRTVATENEGIEELQQGIRDYLDSVDEQRRTARRSARAEGRFRSVLADRLLEHVLGRTLSAADYDRLVRRITDREVDPYNAAEGILSRLEVR